MVSMLCRNRVEDYDRWRRVFDSHGDAHRAAGLRLTAIWQEVDDPRHVFFVLAVEDVERARAFVEDPASARAGEEAGVIDGDYRFVVEAVAPR